MLTTTSNPGHMIATVPRLPIEVIELILEWIDLRCDLLSFARASRAYAALIIPRHTEYRVLRLTGGSEWVPIGSISSLAQTSRRIFA